MIQCRGSISVKRIAEVAPNVSVKITCDVEEKRLFGKARIYGRCGKEKT